MAQFKIIALLVLALFNVAMAADTKRILRMGKKKSSSGSAKSAKAGKGKSAVVPLPNIVPGAMIMITCDATVGGNVNCRDAMGNTDILSACPTGYTPISYALRRTSGTAELAIRSAYPATTMSWLFAAQVPNPGSEPTWIGMYWAICALA